MQLQTRRQTKVCSGMFLPDVLLVVAWSRQEYSGSLDVKQHMNYNSGYKLDTSRCSYYVVQLNRLL
jgi:hypothetical protein